MGEFPEAAFVLGGDPTSIRASGTVWQTFGAAAGDTGADLRHLDSGEFDGDEADIYRSRINHDLPPYLSVTSQAWTLVAAALTGYADTLDQLQTEIAGLRSTGWHQWQTADAARASARQAAADDAAHAADRTAQADALPAGHTLPADTYHPAAADAHAAADRTAADLQTTVDAAAGVRIRNTHAVERCTATIDEARRMRFQDPPGWLGALWDDVCGWVADHIDILQTLSAVLKKIAGIAGMLALIPILAPLAGPVALAAGGLAAGIDAGIKITTGEGDWTQIGLDMAAFISGRQDGHRRHRSHHHPRHRRRQLPPDRRHGGSGFRRCGTASAGSRRNPGAGLRTGATWTQGVRASSGPARSTPPDVPGIRRPTSRHERTDRTRQRAVQLPHFSR